MDSQKFFKARLTIQEFTLPSSQSESKTDFRNTTKRSKIFYSNTNFERKHHSSNPEFDNFKNIKSIKTQREGVQQQDQFVSNLINLPEIDDRQKIYSLNHNHEGRLTSYNSAKLISKSHSRFERQKIVEKYKNKMQIVRQTQNESKFVPYQKKISIHHIRAEGDLKNQRDIIQSIRRISKQKHSRKAFHFNLMEKNHLNRLKNEEAIPLQLQTQKYVKKQRDDDNANLQFKNHVRFKFDNDMLQVKERRDKKTGTKDHLGLIDAWGVDIDAIGGTPFYY